MPKNTSYFFDSLLSKKQPFLCGLMHRKGLVEATIYIVIAQMFSMKSLINKWE